MSSNVSGSLGVGGQVFSLPSRNGKCSLLRKKRLAAFLSILPPTLSVGWRESLSVEIRMRKGLENSLERVESSQGEWSARNLALPATI